MKIAIVTVSGTCAAAVAFHKITAGLTGAAVDVVFTDPAWSGLIKNITFRGGTEKTLLDIGETVRIPKETVAAPNVLLQVGVTGISANGDVVIPTIWADLGTVNPAAPVDPEHTGDDEPGIAPIWAQLEAMIGSLLNLATEDKSSAVAAINEIVGKIGDMDGLSTENKQTLVGAINEIKTLVGDATKVTETVNTLSTTVETLKTAVEKIQKTDQETAEVLEDVLADIADLKYFPIEVSGVTNNVGTQELGRSFDSVTVSWNVNKEPVSQTVAGEAVEASARSAVVSGPFTSDKTFTVTATDERGHTAKDGTSIKFLNGVYYGVLPDGVAIDSAAILTMNRKLQSGKAYTFTATAKEGERFAYALPARYGTPKFNVGGFDYEWEKAATIEFTNASGYTETYIVWRAYQVVVGTRKIVVS